MSKYTECVMSGKTLADKRHNAAQYCSDQCRKKAYIHRDKIKQYVSNVIAQVDSIPGMPPNGDPVYWHEVVGEQLELLEKAVQRRMLEVSNTYQYSYILTSKGRNLLNQWRNENGK